VIPALVLVELDYWIHQRLHAGVLVALIAEIEEGSYASVWANASSPVSIIGTSTCCVRAIAMH